MKYVIFDFNGTVVDDVDVSLDAINHCIEKYLNRNLLTKDEYLHVFTFPVKKYYEAVGFNFKIYNWYEVGNYWMDYYIAHRKECDVYKGVVDCLVENHKKGNKNILLSASMIDNLIEQIDELGISQYFDEVLGIDNIFADGKIPIAKKFLKDKNPDDCIIIGDTIHDYEVAKELNIKYALVAKGHQAKDVLEKECDNVYDDISEVII